VGDDLEQTAIDQNNAYYSQPNSHTGGLSVKQWLANTRDEQLGAEAELRTADGTLKPKSKKLIDTVRAHPTPADLEKLLAHQRPTVTPLGIRFDQDSLEADTPIPGAYFMSTPQAAGEGSGDKAVVVLVIPGEGLREFDSEAALDRYITGRSDDPERRKSLLSLLPAQQRSFLGKKDFTLSPSDSPLPRIPANHNFFEHSVQGQIDQQNANIRYEFEQAKARGVDLDELDAIGSESTSDLEQSFDTAPALAERDALLVEQNRPEWWKNSTDQERQDLDDLQTEADESEVRTHTMVADKIPTMEAFAAEKIKQEMKVDYPGIDPDYVEVKITITTQYATVAYQAMAGETRTRYDYVTLTEYALMNTSSWESPSTHMNERRTVSATFVDQSGKTVTLGENYVNSLVTKLNVAQQYEDLLKDQLLNAQKPEIREAWKHSYESRMRADAQQAKLEGAFDAYDDKRSDKWIRAVMDYPDPSTRPTIDGYEIEARTLSIGTNRQDRASLDGIMVIGAKSGTSTIVLYTPNASDGKVWREYRDKNQMTADPALRTEEMKDYFASRVSENARENTKAAFTDRRTEFFTDTITTNASDAMYNLHANTVITTADVKSTTNDEVRDTSTLNIILFGLDIFELATDLIPGKSLLTGAKRFAKLARTFNPRKAIAKLRTPPRFIKKTDNFGKTTFDVLPDSPATSASTKKVHLQGYELNVDPKDLKYKSDGIYIDGANNEYLKIDGKMYRTHLRVDDGEIKRFVYHGANGTVDRFEVKRVRNKWIAQPRDQLAGGGKRPLEEGAVEASAPKRVQDEKVTVKVTDQSDSLTHYTHTQLGDSEVTKRIGLETQKKLDDKYGKDTMEIVGYHVSPAENQNSLRTNGFSYDYNEGRGEGVAGANKNGPGLYVSTKPTNTHISKDGKYIIYAVYRRKDASWNLGTNQSIAWNKDANANLNGDYIRANASGDEIKINPEGLPKVSMMEIGETKLRENISNGLPSSTPKPSTLTYAAASEWVSKKILDPKYSDSFNKIVAETDVTKRDQLITDLAEAMLEDNPGSGVRRPHVKKWLDDHAKPKQ
jgi:hypothetical protein